MAWNLIIRAILTIAKEGAKKIAKSTLIRATKTGTILKGVKNTNKVMSVLDFFKSIKKEGVKQVFKETAKEQAYSNIVGKIIKWKKGKDKEEKRQQKNLEFKDAPDNYVWDYKGNRQYKYQPDFMYDFALKNYGYRLNVGMKIWREYDRLKKALNKEYDVWLTRQLSYERKQYNKDRIQLKRQLERQEKEFQKKIQQFNKEFIKLEKNIDKYFEIEDKLKWSNFKEQRKIPLSYKHFNYLRKDIFQQAAKQRFNTNQLDKELEDFTDWFDTLKENEQKLIIKDVFNTQGTKLEFIQDGWIKAAIWVPLTEHLEPNKLGIKNNETNETSLLEFRSNQIINSNTRGFLHVWVNKPSRKNPSGKYTWWNITLRTWNKIKNERTTEAFEKYFYRANKANMKYLLPNSIYWRKSERSIKWMEKNNKIWKDKSQIKKMRRKRKTNNSGWFLPSKSTI